MTHALLYRPTHPARPWLAFLAAIIIHLAAVTLAGVHPPQDVSFVPSGPDPAIVVVVDLPPTAPLDPPTLPDEMPPPVPPLEPPEFVDPEATPNPTKSKPLKPQRPIERQPGAPSTLPMSSVRALATFSPRPAYPYEARRQKITGEGMALLTVETASGIVRDVTMLASTGNDLLDQSTVAALRRWRFQPGTVSRVKCPITFTLTGAQY